MEELTSNLKRNRGVLLLVCLTLLGLAASCAGEIEQQKVVELRGLANQTPVYPGFEEIDERVVIKAGLVHLYKDYKSKAKFSEVKSFYDTELSKQGWGPPQQPAPSIFVGEKNLVSYRRGDFAVIVNQGDGLREVFSVVFEWAPE